MLNAGGGNMEPLFSREFIPNKIVLACFVPKGTSAAFHRNRPSHGFAICTEGSPKYYFSDGTTLTSEAGKAIYLPKHSDYIIKDGNKSSSYAINFDFPDDRFHDPILFDLQNFSVLKYFQTAEQAWRKRTSDYQEQCFSSLYAIAGILRKELTRDYLPSSRTILLHPAIEHINSHYAEATISIPEIAEVCGISPQYLRRLFRSVYGMSPVDYIRQLRLNRAAELIGSGLYSIHDAAFLSGFLDDSYFSREFRKVYGISPTAYKNRTVK